MCCNSWSASEASEFICYVSFASVLSIVGKMKQLVSYVYKHCPDMTRITVIVAIDSEFEAGAFLRHSCYCQNGLVYRKGDGGLPCLFC